MSNNNSGGRGTSNPSTISHQNSPIPNGTPVSEVSGIAGIPPQQTTQSYTHDNSQSEQQSPHIQQQMPPMQHRYPHRDGPATINLPPGTRIQPSILSTDANTTAVTVQPQDSQTAALYSHQLAYPSAAVANNQAANYIQSYNAAATSMGGQFYAAYQPTGQYYQNPATGYAVTPQALIMQQPNTVHQAGAYHQLLNQAGMAGQHAHQMLASSAVQPQQQQTGIPATVVSHIQPSNVVVTSASGAVPANSNMQTPQNMPTPSQQQAPKKKRILQFFDPTSGEELKLGSESKQAPANIVATGASDEEKSTEIKSEFLKKVSERVKEEVAGVPQQQNSALSPSSFAGSETPQQPNLTEQAAMPKSSSGVDLQMNVDGFENHLAGVPPPSQMQQQQNPGPAYPAHHQPAAHHIPTTIVSGGSISSIEHAQTAPITTKSPNPPARLMDLDFTQPSPQPQQHLFATTHQKMKEEELLMPSQAQPMPTFGVLINPYMEEQKIVVGPDSNIGSEKQRQNSQSSQNEKRSIIPDIAEQELNGENQSPTPTEGAEEAGAVTTEKIRELEDEMCAYHEKREANHDTEELIYNRSFLMFLRKVTQVIKAVKCPKSEDELQELGLSRRGMTNSQYTAGGKTKRFDMAGGDSMFKPSWQQPGGTGSQFGGGPRFNRPPNYMGRHSDNKMKQKKGPIGRPSLDQRQPIKLSQVQQQQEVLPRKSANAWKSKREERFDMNAPQKDEEELKYEKLKKEIRGLLNKVTPSTYEELSIDFCAYKITEDPKLLIPIIDLIFEKAVEEPHFCPLYSDLCEKQVVFETKAKEQRDKTPDGQAHAPQKQKEKSFKNEIIFKCQRTFLASQEYDNKVKDLEEKLKKASEEGDDKSRAQVEEEIELCHSKEKRRLLGIIKFIGQLYRHKLLVEIIIDWCAYELIKRYNMTKEEVYIEYCVELIKTVGKIYEERKEEALQQAARQAQQRTAAQVTSGNESRQEYRLDAVFGNLIILKPHVSSRVKFAIMNLEDLRKNGWVPRGGEKGPKTIEQVREELKKEQENNEIERIEHEKKDKDKLQPLRKASGRAGYVGRSSADRRQAAAVTSSLLSRDSKAESRISGNARLTDLDDMPYGRKAWQPNNRDKTPQKDGGGGTDGGNDAWRSTKSDSPKDG